MKRNFLLIGFQFLILLIIGLSSCENLDSNNNNYQNLRIGRMDLSGAKQLAIVNSNTRAIDGEFLSAGLYKIDENGNFSAVAVYFTTDLSGNRLEKEYALKVSPKHLFKLSDNYILAASCDYYDADGDFVQNQWMESAEDEDGYWVRQEVPYKNLLVRLSDGKVWCVDNIKDMLYTQGYHFDSSDKYVQEYYLKGDFYQSKSGELYFRWLSNEGINPKYPFGCIFKFNLSGDDPSFNQLTTIGLNDMIDITDNGAILNYNSSEMTVAWPQQGFQKLSAKDLSEEAYPDRTTHYFNSTCEEIFPTNDIIENLGYSFSFTRMVDDSYIWLVNVNGIPGLIVFGDVYINGYKSLIVDPNNEVFSEYLKNDIGRYYDIVIGDTPGSARMCDNPIIMPMSMMRKLSEYGPSGGYGVHALPLYCGKDHVVLYDNLHDENGNYTETKLYKINTVSRSWEFLKAIDFKIESGRFGHRFVDFEDKIWMINYDDKNNFGAYFLDKNTLEYGFVRYNVTIPEWMENKTSWYLNHNNKCDGILRYTGINPSNNNTEELLIDITTGKVVENVTAAKYSFDILVSLN